MAKKDTERRTSDRVEIPETSVQYKISSSKLDTFKNYSDPQKLINISKSGVSFDLIESVSYGDPVDLKLHFADGNRVQLKGKVRWSKIGEGYAVKTVGVLFEPFGNQKKYNPIKALEYLRTLKDKAADSNPPSSVENISN